VSLPVERAYPEVMDRVTPSAAEPLRVVLVEDSVLLREGLVRLFDEAGYLTAGAWGDAVDVVDRVRAAEADVAILDMRLPPGFRDEGIRAALALRAALPALGILVLSQYVEGVYARELLAEGEGGIGYLLKDRVTSLDEFTDAVRRVHDGGTVLDPLVVRQLIAARPDPHAAHTPRERAVLELMAEGRSNATIAARLFIGVGAVEKNVSAIFQKLGLEESGTDHRRVLAVLAFLQR
jgi:DNA-binding NarL/FixJ family response regulator